MIRRNIDAWWPQVEAGAEAILVTASGCGAMVKDYGALLAAGPGLCREGGPDRQPWLGIRARCWRSSWPARRSRCPGRGPARKIAFHSPCSLQHGQKLPGLAEGLLTRLGYELTPVADGHLCCGSAGSYSLLQPTLARQLRDNKLASLAAGGPELHRHRQCRLPVAPGVRHPDSRAALDRAG